jgi:hypothetical protein
MKTLHIKGYAKDIDLTSFFSDNYDHDLRFDFDEESEDSMPNIFFRFYSCDKECSLEEAIKGNLEKMFGCLNATGKEYGYSEYTVEGFDISELTLGGHNIGDIINKQGDKYLHILIDQLPPTN